MDKMYVGHSTKRDITWPQCRNLWIGCYFLGYWQTCLYVVKFLVWKCTGRLKRWFYSSYCKGKMLTHDGGMNVSKKKRGSGVLLRKVKESPERRWWRQVLSLLGRGSFEASWNTRRSGGISAAFWEQRAQIKFSGLWSPLLFESCFPYSVAVWP